MPNHVKNVLHFDCTDEQFERIRELLRRPDGPPGTVDFNRLDPMPESLNIEAGARGDNGYVQYRNFRMTAAHVTDPAERNQLEEKFRANCMDEASWKLGKQYYENIQNFGSPHWYDWCIDHWGTKWNAYDPVVHDAKDKTLEFSTAWAAVPGMVLKLSQTFPEANIHFEFADEDIGRNVGEIDFSGGRVTNHHYPPTHSKEAFEMAARVRGLDLEKDLRLFLDPSRNTYVYIPEHEEAHKEKPAPSRDGWER